ncbi:MAG: ABC transporter permease [Desulfurococcaceae archaeon]
MTIGKKRILQLRTEFFSLIILVCLLIIFSIASNYRFLSYENLRAISRLLPDLGIVAIGIALLMVSGEFDLSISSQIPLCSFLMMQMLMGGFGEIPSFLITVCVGAVLGFINAVITIKGRIPSFITTLGTMLLWRGVVYVASGMMPIALRPYLPEYSLLKDILVSEIFGVPIQIIWFGVIALILGLILHRHKFGNWIYATGDNPSAARAMGINTTITKTICFMIVGVLSALASIMQILRVGSFFSRAGEGWELKAIAAAVLGGTSLRGGIGSMYGAVLGAFAIILIENAITILRIDYFWTYIVQGAIIVLYTLATTGIQKLKES